MFRWSALTTLEKWLAGLVLFLLAMYCATVGTYTLLRNDGWEALSALSSLFAAVGTVSAVIVALLAYQHQRETLRIEFRALLVVQMSVDNGPHKTHEIEIKMENGGKSAAIDVICDLKITPFYFLPSDADPITIRTFSVKFPHILPNNISVHKLSLVPGFPSFYSGLEVSQIYVDIEATIKYRDTMGGVYEEPQSLPTYIIDTPAP